MRNNPLNKILLKRYEKIKEIKADIEELTKRKVYCIVDEGRTDATNDFGTDCEILFEFENYEQHTIFYLKDNMNRYVITEV